MKRSRSLLIPCFLASVVLLCCSADKKKEPIDPPKTEQIAVDVTRALRMTQQARVPQNDPSFDRAEVFADRIVFHFKSLPKQKLEKGHVVAGGGDGRSPYLRRNADVIASTDTRVEVRTEAAYLTDFFGDGAFTAKLTPAASSWTLHADPTISGRRYLLDTKLKMMNYEAKNGFSCSVAGSAGMDLTPKFEPDVGFNEALAQTVIDVSGRSYFVFNLDLPKSKIGVFDVELVSEFFQAFSANSDITLHMNSPYWSNLHHVI